MVISKLNKMIRRVTGLFVRDERGQGMTEYIILVGLIAIACITAVYIFGDNISKLFQSADTGLANPSTGAGSADIDTAQHHKTWDE